MNLTVSPTAEIEIAMQEAAAGALATWLELRPDEWIQVPWFHARVNCLGQVQRTTAAGVPVNGGKLVKHRPDGTVCVAAVSGTWFDVPVLALIGLAIGKQWPDVERLATTKKPQRRRKARASPE